MATTRPMLANNGKMSEFVGVFDVQSKLTGNNYRCRFSHMWNGIAHTAFTAFRDKTGRDLTDREASFIAAEFLRERLEEEDERKLYDVPHDAVLRLISQIGIK